MVSFIVVMYVVLTITVSVMNGGGGMNTTTLTSAISATDTTIHVISTSGFLTADYLIIGGEKLTYSGKTATTFTGCARSSGVAHSAGSKAYSQQTSVINDTLNYNIGAVTSDVGIFAVVVVPFKFFTTAIPNIVSQGLPFTGVFSFLSYFWFGLTCGIIVSIALALIWVASGIVGKVTGG